MAPGASLQSLPPEIHLIVLKHLSTHDHSLRAFACVSRICHNLASPLIYHTIKIGVDSENIRFLNLHQWAQSPQGRTRLQLVRWLAIYNTRESRGPTLRSTDSGNTSIRPVFISENPSARHGRLQLHKELKNNAEPRARSPPRPSNDVWLRLADLILQLPGLTDLFFFLPTEFPECLLDRIHRFRPECRLHIDGIVLRNLATASTDSYEFRLASSPCLYSIKAIDHTDSNSDTDKSSSYYQDIVPLMASGLAPNLKEVSLVYHYSWSATLDPFILSKWRGFHENTLKSYSNSRGSLQFLRLQHGWLMTKDVLDNWSARTDFTKLQTLELQARLEPEVLNYLAKEFHFPCLTTLVLGKFRRLEIGMPVVCENSAGVHKLLSALPSLESLTLDGWYPGISIETLAITLGPSLLELKLLNYPSEDLTSDDLEALGRHCQRLRNFTLSLRRSQGDSKEASLYKALGSAPSLQFIILDLHVDKKFEISDIEDDEDGNVWNPAYDDEFDRMVPPETVEESDTCNGAMREQLINCAIDAKLARSIFDTISTGKPQTSLPLQELNIQIIGAGDFGRVSCSLNYHSVIHHICHSWRITRSIGYDRCHEIQRMQAVPNLFLPPPHALESYLEAIWRRIWPERISEDWRSDWCSLPISELT